MLRLFVNVCEDFLKMEDRKRRLKNKKRMQDKARTWIRGYLSEHPCVDCGNTDHRVLEFDHVDPEKKKFTICRKIKDGVSLITLAKEVEKCQVRCANCHRIRTKEEKHCYPKNTSAKDPDETQPKKVEIFHKRTGILSD